MQIDAKDLTVRLTEMGKDFSDWLVRTNRKANYLRTFFGGWGERKLPQGMPAGFLEQFNGMTPEQFQRDVENAFTRPRMASAEPDAQQTETELGDAREATVASGTANGSSAPPA